MRSSDQLLLFSNMVNQVLFDSIVFFHDRGCAFDLDIICRVIIRAQLFKANDVVS